MASIKTQEVALEKRRKALVRHCGGYSVEMGWSPVLADDTWLLLEDRSLLLV